MYFQDKKIKGKRYKYAVESLRLPGGKVKTLQKRYKGESKEKLKNFFDKKRKEEFVKYALRNFKVNHVFTKEQIKKIEEIKVDYSKILKKLPKKNLQDLIDRFTANFTYESNALEGNSLTLKDVSLVMFENISPEGKDLREIYETRNSRKIVELIFKNKFKITEKDIIKIHGILVEDLDTRTGYKKFPNVIVGKSLETTPPEKVSEEIKKLIKWYKNKENTIHPLELASLFHGKFEQIHPFEDGNGRVGRFLINIILVNHKYPPLIIRKSQRISYLSVLEKFDDGHKDTLKRLFLKRFKETYKKFFKVYIEYI